MDNTGHTLRHMGRASQACLDPNHRISVSLLAINSLAFMYWDENFKTVTSLCEESSKRGALSWLMTVRGTVHISHNTLLHPISLYGFFFSTDA